MKKRKNKDTPTIDPSAHLVKFKGLFSREVHKIYVLNDFKWWQYIPVYFIILPICITYFELVYLVRKFK